MIKFTFVREREKKPEDKFCISCGRKIDYPNDCGNVIMVFGEKGFELEHLKCQIHSEHLLDILDLD